MLGTGIGSPVIGLKFEIQTYDFIHWIPDSRKNEIGFFLLGGYTFEFKIGRVLP